MTDIHSHIIPGVDDGSPDLVSSLEMLSMAADSGVRRIAATSHCNIPGMFSNYADLELLGRLNRLKEAAAAEKIPIEIFQGMEVYSTEDMADLIRGKRVWTLNGTRYFLMEFAFDEEPAFCEEILTDVKACGLKPVIAHPERYFFIQDEPQIAFEWCTTGCILQLNKGSILGRFGAGPERTADALLRHGLAACVASDAHSPHARTTDMQEVRQYLRRIYGDDYMRLLLEENTARILKGQGLFGYEPQPFM